MRFTFDLQKSRQLRANPKRGIGFEEAREIFYRPYRLDRRSDVPEQYIAVGWVSDKLYSVIFEVREDEEARFCISSRYGGQRRKRFDCMKKALRSAKPVAAEEIAQMADRGENVSRFFKGEGRMVQPIQRVNVDLTADMLAELDKAALDLNVSRQAVIKTLVRQALDQHYVAQSARRPSVAFGQVKSRRPKKRD